MIQCPAILGMWSPHLKGHGIEIYLASRVESIQKTFDRENGQFDLIVTKHHFPQDEGTGRTQVIDLIKQIAPTFRPKPILACSLIPDEVEEMRVAGATHGCSDYLQVPAQILKLLRLQT
jgi:CheY-like chemotaxis protein